MNENRFIVIYRQESSFGILVDKDTGINYLFFNGALTPLLDSRGYPVVTRSMYLSESPL